MFVEECDDFIAPPAANWKTDIWRQAVSISDNVVNLDVMLWFNSYRIVVTISRQRVLLVQYLKITVVNPTYLDIWKTIPGLVLSQKAVPLIQFIFRFSEARIVVEVT